VNTVCCIPENTSPFSAVSSGLIRLTGFICRCAFFALGTGVAPLPGDGNDARIQYGQETCKFTFDTDDDGASSGEELYSFQVCSFPEVRYYIDAYGVRNPPWNPDCDEARSATWYSHALVLRGVNNAGHAYRRIGISARVPKRWFEKSGKSVITIL
jgi:hypothetical protein